MNETQRSFCRILLRFLDNGLTLSDALSARQSMPGKNRIMAHKILHSMQNGTGFPAAFNAACIPPPGTACRCFLRIAGMTGDTAAALRAMLDYSEQSAAFTRTLAQSVAYPTGIIVLSLTLCLGMSRLVIPLLEGSGGNVQSLAEAANRGSLHSFLFCLLVCLPAVFGMLRILLRARAASSYWWSVCALLEAGVQPAQAQEQSLLLLVQDRKHSRKKYLKFLHTDPFTRVMLRTARDGGDFRGAVQAIARYRKKECARICDLIAHYAEPAAMLVAGGSLLILAMEVIIPIFSHTGGVL